MRPVGSEKTPGSGRKKGSINKKSVLLIEKAQGLGIDPFEILLYFAAGDWKALGYAKEKTDSGQYLIEPSVRMKAAGEACQYIHPKLKQIESTIKRDLIEERPLKDLSDEELESIDVS